MTISISVVSSLVDAELEQINLAGGHQQIGARERAPSEIAKGRLADHFPARGAKTQGLIISRTLNYGVVYSHYS